LKPKAEAAFIRLAPNNLTTHKTPKICCNGSTPQKKAQTYLKPKAEAGIRSGGDISTMIWVFGAAQRKK
jgi:hypothetical protein